MKFLPYLFVIFASFLAGCSQAEEQKIKEFDFGPSPEDGEFKEGNLH